MPSLFTWCGAWQSDIRVGCVVQLGYGPETDVRRVVGFGSVLLDAPLRHAHGAGAMVQVFEAGRAPPLTPAGAVAPSPAAAVEPWRPSPNVAVPSERGAPAVVPRSVIESSEEEAPLRLSVSAAASRRAEAEDSVLLDDGGEEPRGHDDFGEAKGAYDVDEEEDEEEEDPVDALLTSGAQWQGSSDPYLRHSLGLLSDKKDLLRVLRGGPPRGFRAPLEEAPEEATTATEAAGASGPRFHHESAHPLLPSGGGRVIRYDNEGSISVVGRERGVWSTDPPLAVGEDAYAAARSEYERTSQALSTSASLSMDYSGVVVRVPPFFVPDVADTLHAPTAMPAGAGIVDDKAAAAAIAQAKKDGLAVSLRNVGELAGILSEAYIPGVDRATAGRRTYGHGRFRFPAADGGDDDEEEEDEEEGSDAENSDDDTHGVVSMFAKEILRQKEAETARRAREAGLQALEDSALRAVADAPAAAPTTTASAPMAAAAPERGAEETKASTRFFGEALRSPHAGAISAETAADAAATAAAVASASAAVAAARAPSHETKSDDEESRAFWDSLLRRPLPPRGADPDTPEGATLLAIESLRNVAAGPAGLADASAPAAAATAAEAPADPRPEIRYTPSEMRQRMIEELRKQEDIFICAMELSQLEQAHAIQTASHVVQHILNHAELDAMERGKQQELLLQQQAYEISLATTITQAQVSLQQEAIIARERSLAVLTAQMAEQGVINEYAQLYAQANAAADSLQHTATLLEAEKRLTEERLSHQQESLALTLRAQEDSAAATAAAAAAAAAHAAQAAVAAAARVDASNLAGRKRASSSRGAEQAYGASERAAGAPSAGAAAGPRGQGTEDDGEEEEYSIAFEQESTRHATPRTAPRPRPSSFTSTRSEVSEYSDNFDREVSEVEDGSVVKKRSRRGGPGGLEDSADEVGEESMAVSTASAGDGEVPDEDGEGREVSYSQSAVSRSVLSDSLATDTPSPAKHTYPPPRGAVAPPKTAASPARAAAHTHTQGADVYSSDSFSSGRDGPGGPGDWRAPRRGSARKPPATRLRASGMDLLPAGRGADRPRPALARLAASVDSPLDAVATQLLAEYKAEMEARLEGQERTLKMHLQVPAELYPGRYLGLYLSLTSPYLLRLQVLAAKRAQQLAWIAEQRAALPPGGGGRDAQAARLLDEQEKDVEHEYAEGRALVERERWSASARSYRDLRQFYQLQQVRGGALLWWLQ